MRDRSAAVFARYAVLQLPGMLVAGAVLVLLVRWEQLTAPLAWLLFGFWVLKDVLMFPVVRIAYETGSSGHASERLVGATGTVRREIAPGNVGWVQVGPERWQARAFGDETLPEGTAVRVVSVRGLTLRVVREEA